MAAIEIHHVSKRYQNGTAALEDISFCIDGGMKAMRRELWLCNLVTYQEFRQKATAKALGITISSCTNSAIRESPEKFV